jgi:hypothetical protein
MTDEPAGQPVPEDIHRIAARLYESFAAHDGRALRALLTPGFRGVVAEGMPHGFGGVYEGAETMLRDCWGPVFALVDLRPRPTEYLPVADDRMVVLGRYEGTARGTGSPCRRRSHTCCASPAAACPKSCRSPTPHAGATRWHRRTIASQPGAAAGAGR